MGRIISFEDIRNFYECIVCKEPINSSKVHLLRKNETEKEWVFHFCCSCGWASDISISQECSSNNLDLDNISFEESSGAPIPPLDRYTEVIITNDGDIRKTTYIKGEKNELS